MASLLARDTRQDSESPTPSWDLGRALRRPLPGVLVRLRWCPGSKPGRHPWAWAQTGCGEQVGNFRNKNTFPTRVPSLPDWRRVRWGRQEAARLVEPALPARDRAWTIRRHSVSRGSSGGNIPAFGVGRQPAHPALVLRRETGVLGSVSHLGMIHSFFCSQ